MSNFALVLFDFDLRQRLVKQTDAKLLTSYLVDYFTDVPALRSRRKCEIPAFLVLLEIGNSPLENETV